MDEIDVSHREIYDRLLAVEHKVDKIDRATENVVAAFSAAQGAFTVLEWLGRLAKPILWVGGAITAIGITWQNFREVRSAAWSRSRWPLQLWPPYKRRCP